TKLTDILSGNIVPIPQDNAKSSTTRLISKNDGLIDWSKPAIDIEREIRAYLGWPGSRTEIVGAEAIITEARLLPKDGPAGAAYKTPASELAVYAAKGSLIID